MAIAAQAVPVQTHVERVVSHLVGVMDTTKQADNNPKAPSVRMTTCRVQMVEVPEMVYLYQEQALTKNLDHPYRQRILQIKPSEDGQTVISESFKVINAEQLIGLCNQPETSRKLTLETLDKSVCSVFLKPKDNGYIGNTPPEGCPANVRGALTITNTILLHETGMDTWDRGLDENGNQVWGARKDSYQYRWVQ
ncbi:MAG TPA: chorismate mutase [Cyanothece sp. UBA12306]|nr:chorismate mutase [Cyanothece sp. UBA12306]